MMEAKDTMLAGMLAFIGFISIQSVALATPINNAGSGLVSPQNTITFNEVVLPVGTAVTNQFAAFGATFDDWTYNNGNGSSIPSPILAHFSGALDADIFFNDPVTDAAFRLQTNSGTTLFEALLSGSLVESFSAATTFPDSTDWFGFQNIVFDQIRITPGGSRSAAVLGQLQFNNAAVPLPSTIFLLAVGLACAARISRKTAGNCQ